MSEEREEVRGRDPTAAGDTGIQISSMIDKIMANPELISMVASALGGSSGKSESAEKEKEQAEAAEGGNETAVSASESAGLPSMEKLPELVAAIAPMLSSAGGKSPSLGKLSAPKDKRACLLAALKPYLSRERCEAIDYMIRLGALSEVFRGLGG